MFVIPALEKQRHPCLVDTVAYLVSSRVRDPVSIKQCAVPEFGLQSSPLHTCVHIHTCVCTHIHLCVKAHTWHHIYT